MITTIERSFETNDVLRYFVISTTFNLVRIMALGLVIGYLYKSPRVDEYR